MLVYVCFPSSHALTSDVSIEETARAAEFFLSDGLIITGTATGVQADPRELRGKKLHTSYSREPYGAAMDASFDHALLDTLA